MKKQQLTSFYFEALLLVAAFTAIILVLTGVFGAARAKSASARRLTEAVTIAANAAEALSGADSIEETAALLDEGGNVRVMENGLEAGKSLMSPRVTVCAAHQANMTVRLILGHDDV